MKNLLLSLSIICVSFISCEQQVNNELKKENLLKVLYLDQGGCCSNMETLNLEPIFSDITGYSETILFAVNLNDFSSIAFEKNDSLAIEYIFSSEEITCNHICNRYHGIPIELTSLEKL